jgi:hypothetical protein
VFSTAAVRGVDRYIVVLQLVPPKSGLIRTTHVIKALWIQIGIIPIQNGRLGTFNDKSRLCVECNDAS